MLVGVLRLRCIAGGGRDERRIDCRGLGMVTCWSVNPISFD